jgi:hypothetical protein
MLFLWVIMEGLACLTTRPGIWDVAFVFRLVGSRRVQVQGEGGGGLGVFGTFTSPGNDPVSLCLACMQHHGLAACSQPCWTPPIHHDHTSQRHGFFGYSSVQRERTIQLSRCMFCFWPGISEWPIKQKDSNVKHLIKALSS